MSKLYLFLFLLAGCASISRDYVPRDGCIASVPKVELAKDKRALSISHDLSTYGLTVEQKIRVSTAIELLKRVISTKEFKEEVLGHTWKDEQQFAHTTMDNEAVYEAILKGSEDFKPGDDNEIDLYITMFTRDDDTIAYTRWGIPMIYLNTKYFSHDIPKLADTIMHEWLHKLGFRHPEEDKESRDYSVPYGVGDIIHRISTKYYLRYYSCR